MRSEHHYRTFSLYIMRSHVYFENLRRENPPLIPFFNSRLVVEFVFRIFNDILHKMFGYMYIIPKSSLGRLLCYLKYVYTVFVTLRPNDECNNVQMFYSIFLYNKSNNNSKFVYISMFGIFHLKIVLIDILRIFDKNMYLLFRCHLLFWLRDSRYLTVKSLVRITTNPTLISYYIYILITGLPRYSCI